MTKLYDTNFKIPSNVSTPPNDSFLEIRESFARKTAAVIDKIFDDFDAQMLSVERGVDADILTSSRIVRNMIPSGSALLPMWRGNDFRMI